MKFLFRKGHKHSDATKRKLSLRKIGSKNPMWKGGKFGDGHGYIRITVKPKVYRLEHRVVMEKYLGRKLKKDEHVHHINGNKKDNRIKNLKVLKKSEHHRLLRKRFICKIKNCNRVHRAKGFCAVHFNRAFGYGGYKKISVISETNLKIGLQK